MHTLCYVYAGNWHIGKDYQISSVDALCAVINDAKKTTLFSTSPLEQKV